MKSAVTRDTWTTLIISLCREVVHVWLFFDGVITLKINPRQADKVLSLCVWHGVWFFRRTANWTTCIVLLYLFYGICSFSLSVAYSYYNLHSPWIWISQPTSLPSFPFISCLSNWNCLDISKSSNYPLMLDFVPYFVKKRIFRIFCNTHY